MSSPTVKASTVVGSAPEWLELVRSKVEALSFGTVQIVIHEGKVTQIERTEKTRIDAPVVDHLRRRENY